MNIIITSIDQVTIDGAGQGTVVDALFKAAQTGNEAIRAPFHDALIAFVASQIAIQSKADSDSAANLKTQTDAQIADLQKQLADALAATPVAVAAQKKIGDDAAAALTQQLGDSQVALQAAQTNSATAAQSAATALADMTSQRDAANAARDSVITQSQQLAQAANDILTQIQPLGVKLTGIVATANQSYLDRVAAEKAAQKADLTAKLAALG